MVTENNGRVLLARNDNNEKNVLRANGKSIASGSRGVGTILVGIAKNKRMVRRVKTGSSFMSHSEQTVTFGLGSEEVLDSLYVYWPNGSMEVFLNINSGQEINITEERGKWTVQ